MPQLAIRSRALVLRLSSPTTPAPAASPGRCPPPRSATRLATAHPRRHLNRLRRTGPDPTPDAFAAHLTERATGPVPVPQTPYGYDPLHDPRLSCRLDLQHRPATAGAVARCSPVVLQQETGQCGWNRITRTGAPNGSRTRTPR